MYIFLKAIESQFQYVQKMLILESNDLLSSHYLYANEDMNGIWRQSMKPEDTFWIFGILEKTSKRQVIAFYSSDYEEVTFPLKQGGAFSRQDSKEAIVEMEVETHKLNGIEYIDYDHIQYILSNFVEISSFCILRKLPTGIITQIMLT